MIYVPDVDVIEEDYGSLYGDPKELTLESLKSETADQTSPQTSQPIPQKGSINHQHPTTQQSNSLVSNQSAQSSLNPPQNLMKIPNLTPETTDFTILVRVLNKSFREYGLINGSGKLFSLILLDDTGIDIPALGFHDVCDQLYDKFEVGKVYSVSGGTVVKNNGYYGNSKSDFEIIFDSNTIVTPAFDDKSIGNISFSFKKLRDILELDDGSFIDIIAVVQKYDQVKDFTSKRNTKLKKRNLKIIDDSNYSIELVLWNDETTKFPQDQQNPIISVKNAKFLEYQGVKTLMITPNSIVVYNQNCKEKSFLENWFASLNQGSYSFVNISKNSILFPEFKYLSEVYSFHLKEKEKIYFTSIVKLLDILSSRKLYYLACPNEDCKFCGVVSQNGVGYICKRCRQPCSNPVPRYNLQIEFADMTGSVTTKVIGNETLGELFTGMKIDEIVRLGQDPNGFRAQKELRSRLSKRFFREFKVKFNASNDNYYSSTKVQIMCDNAIEIFDYGSESKRILQELKKD